jgi:3D (Asp-Asp-Asp) domain-containing protein
MLLSSAVAVVSTAYCLSGTMADGTQVRAGSVASNQHPLGTHLIVSSSPTGQRHWVVRDRIGWGTELDFWVPTCGQAYSWGRRTVRISKHQHYIETYRRHPRKIVARKTRYIIENTTQGVPMNEFLENLKRQAAQNPIVALGVAAAVITSISKFIDASGHAKGSRAYARDVDRRIKKSQK